MYKRSGWALRIELRTNVRVGEVTVIAIREPPMNSLVPWSFWNCSPGQ